MKREILDYLEDIKNECEYLLNKSQSINYDSFESNEDLKRAFVRSLEIIGEAAKQIPKEIKKSYPQIPWSKVIGIRNIMVHEYFGVNYQVVWKVIKERIPALYEVIIKIINEIKNG